MYMCTHLRIRRRCIFPRREKLCGCTGVHWVNCCTAIGVVKVDEQMYNTNPGQRQIHTTCRLVYIHFTRQDGSKVGYAPRSVRPTALSSQILVSSSGFAGPGAESCPYAKCVTPAIADIKRSILERYCIVLMLWAESAISAMELTYILKAFYPLYAHTISAAIDSQWSDHLISRREENCFRCWKRIRDMILVSTLGKYDTYANASSFPSIHRQCDQGATACLRIG